MKNLIHSLFFLISFLLACDSKQSTASQEDSSFNPFTIKYAKGFTVTRQNNYTILEVKQPYPGATTGYRYLLVPKGEAVPDHDADTKVIRVPITSIVCTSTTHIPLLDYLDKTEALLGFPALDYISSERTRKLIDSGKVIELGIEKGMNIEKLISLSPDLVMGYTLSSDYGQFKKIEELGVPVVVNAEYLEHHPLGRSEWIKFMALFFGVERLADSIFTEIEKNYLTTSALTIHATRQPTVMSGVVYGDTWFLPGGQNYAAKLLRDAGYHYLWSDDSSNGFLQVSFEAVYEKASSADFWIGVASNKSLQELKSADNRYTMFRPFQTGNVYSYNARYGAKGGTEFLELGYLRADLVLQDLVKIGHTDLLPNHELYFHMQLK